MSDHPTTATTLLIAEVAAGAWVADALAHLPPGVVGAASALCVGVTLRLFDAPLRALSEWMVRRWARPRVPPVEPPDATG